MVYQNCTRLGSPQFFRYSFITRQTHTSFLFLGDAGTGGTAPLAENEASAFLISNPSEVHDFFFVVVVVFGHRALHLGKYTTNYRWLSVGASRGRVAHRWLSARRRWK